MIPTPIQSVLTPNGVEERAMDAWSSRKQREALQNAIKKKKKGCNETAGSLEGRIGEDLSS